MYFLEAHLNISGAKPGRTECQRGGPSWCKTGTDRVPKGGPSLVQNRDGQSAKGGALPGAKPWRTRVPNKLLDVQIKTEISFKKNSESSSRANDWWWYWMIPGTRCITMFNGWQPFFGPVWPKPPFLRPKIPFLEQKKTVFWPKIIFSETSSNFFYYHDWTLKRQLFCVDCVARQALGRHRCLAVISYIQKVKMSADFAFQSKKICGKSA